jgi:hypothetical protein
MLRQTFYRNVAPTDKEINSRIHSGKPWPQLRLTILSCGIDVAPYNIERLIQDTRLAGNEKTSHRALAGLSGVSVT